MSRLDELVQKYCPNGVEYVPLWSVTIWDKKFNAVDKRKQPVVYNYPYLLAKDLFSLEEENGDVFLLSTGEQTGWTTEERAGENLREGEVVTIPWGKSRAVVDCIKYYKGKFVTADNRIMTSNDVRRLSNKYLYYWVMTQGELIDSYYRGSGIKHPDMAKVLDMNIPVPPLPVQEEIVRILDTFTELTVELTAELQARKKQYEYYSEKVLNSYIVKDVTLSDILLSIHTGLNPRRFFRVNTDDAKNYYVTIREFKGGQLQFTDKTDRINDEAMRLCNNRSNLEVGDVLFSGTGTIGETYVIEKEPSNWNIKEGVYSLKPNKKRVLSKFLKYYLSSMEMRNKYEMLAEGGTVKSISMKKMGDLIVKLPSIEDQERIIETLDHFNTLCNDLTSGLPAEIENRQKQYEYYRDKLLTFKPLP